MFVLPNIQPTMHAFGSSEGIIFVVHARERKHVFEISLFYMHALTYMKKKTVTTV